MLTLPGSALRNWTTGHFTNGSVNPVGGPTLYAANFQAITFAQQIGGYLDAAGTPNKTLATALKTAGERLDEFLSVLESAGKLDSTLLLVGSKQGQGPIDPKTLEVKDPQTVMDGAGVPVAFFNGEDGGMVSHILMDFFAVTRTNDTSRCTSPTRTTLKKRKQTS